jgi:hypothetical protein
MTANVTAGRKTNRDTGKQLQMTREDPTSTPAPHSALRTPNILVLGGNRGSWNWKERQGDEPTMNGIEAWTFALRGSYKAGVELTAGDFEEYDLIVANLNFGYLPYYQQILSKRRNHRTKVVGLFEGEVLQLETGWKQWSAVADLCDLVIAINGFSVSLLASLTQSPVHFIGIPYPVDGVRKLAIPPEERESEVFLCASPLTRPYDYLASRSLGVPMYAYERTFSRRLREVIRHRSLDKMRYIQRARDLYGDPALTILSQTHLPGFFERTRHSLLWMNLDPRYTWARYVLDAAALGVPIVTTHNTWHASSLFPDLIVESPYDIAGANAIARRLIDDRDFYRHVVRHASSGLDWYRPEATVARLWEALGM